MIPDPNEFEIAYNAAKRRLKQGKALYEKKQFETARLILDEAILDVERARDAAGAQIGVEE